MRPTRVAAAALLAGGILMTIGLAALWIFVPIAGAVLTLIAGAGLVALGYRALPVTR